MRPLADNVAIRPNYIQVVTGQSFTLNVAIEGSDPVVAADVYITFDTSRIEVTQVTNSGVLDLIADQSNLPGGLIRIGAGKLTGTPPSPPFTMLTISARAKYVTGATSFTFNSAETDVQGENGSVKGSLINGTVQIDQPPTSTYTPTPTRTFTPSATPPPTNTPTRTSTPTVTLTPSITPTPSRTPTRTSTFTPTSTPTPQPGDLCVLAFNDLNGNGLRDPGEPLLAGALIRVKDAGMVQVAEYTTTGVAEPKCYSLRPGVYYIQETDPPGFTSTNPNWWGVDLVSLGRFTIAFGDQDTGVTPTPSPSPTVTITVTPAETPGATPSATPTGQLQYLQYLPLVLAE